MELLVSGKNLEVGGPLIGLVDGQMKTEFVYGNEANLMVATRSAGYHSKPHRHFPEQLNYVLDGELLVFVEYPTGNLRAFHAKKGDYFRIPGNWLHWAWNHGKTHCTLIEAHAPVLDPSSRRGSFGLFDPTETPTVNRAEKSETIERDVREVERQALIALGIVL